MFNRAIVYDEAEAFLKRVTYKPGVEFRIDFEPVGLMFRVKLPVKDCYDQKSHIAIDGRRIIPWGRLDGPKKDRISEYIRSVHSLLMDGEAHELDEWLAIDGVKVFNPHDSPSELARLKEKLLETLNKVLGGAHEEQAC